MSKFYMKKYWENKEEINTTDLLTAIKYGANYEANVYIDDKCIFSPLGSELEDNKKSLEEYGITLKRCGKQNKWMYMDETKNKGIYYTKIYLYKQDEIEVNISDYATDDFNGYKFNNMDEVRQQAKEMADQHNIPYNKIHVSSFYEEYQSYNLV